MSDLIFCDKQELIDIANAIRNKNGTSDSLSFPHGFIDSINSISSDAPNDSNHISTTITTDDFELYGSTLTIPELIGTKYFILYGNQLEEGRKYAMTANTDLLFQLIYIHGKIIVGYFAMLDNLHASFCFRPINDNSVIFDESTGTITLEEYFFGRVCEDTSEGNIAYTVYRFD